MQTNFTEFAYKIHYLANTGQFKVFLIVLVLVGILSLITIDQE
jgi:hypothetical protein